MENIVEQTWRFAEKKFVVTEGGTRKHYYHVSMSDRYVFDFTHCGLTSDWYQYDTKEDASYFGNWVNPVTLETVSYAEGDICLTQCASPDDYAREIKEMDKFFERLGYGMNRGTGLDDHDDRHHDKLFRLCEPGQGLFPALTA